MAGWEAQAQKEALESMGWLPPDKARDLEARLREKAEALRRVQEIQPATLEALRLMGVVFDRVPGSTDPEDHWQRVAFRIYNDLCETETIARAALSGEGSDGG